VLVVYILALANGFSETQTRTLTFTTIVVANLSLILTNRSWSGTILSTMRIPNKALWWVVTGTIACLLLVLYVPTLQALFLFGAVPPPAILLSAVAGITSIAWFEIYKYVINGRTSIDPAR